MEREDLIEQLAEDILSYVMSGTISETAVTSGLTHTGLDDRFEDYEMLLDLHFILKPKVLSFIRKLPDRLRTLRTETQSVSSTRRGTVDGRIDWGKTIGTRYREAPGDRSLFVVENRSVDYDIPENLVLKYIVTQIYSTLRSADDYLDQEYEWVRRTWGTDPDLVEELTAIVERNVHVRRIRSPEEYEPTERMVGRAQQARESIYREAAVLVEDYWAIHRGEEDAIEELLSQTTITPSSENRLFELYVFFRFVNALEKVHGRPLKVGTIDSNRDSIVSFDDYDLDVFFDQSGPEGLRFGSRPEESGEGFTRFEDVHFQAERVSNKYFMSDMEARTKRPDIFGLVNADNPDEADYFVIEVKNSKREKTIQRGIKETLEYLAFLKHRDEYVFDEPSYYGQGVRGVLVIQDLEKDTLPVAQQHKLPIRILQASSLEETLPDIMEMWLDGQ